MTKLYGWFSSKHSNLKNMNEQPRIFYTNKGGTTVEVTFVSKKPVLNKDSYIWDDAVFMGEIIKQVIYKPNLHTAIE